jgi:hypothetical protein
MQTPISLATLKLHNDRLTELIQELEDNFPPFNPHPNDAERMVMYKAGQRSVIEYILSKLEED